MVARWTLVAGRSPCRFEASPGCARPPPSAWSCGETAITLLRPNARCLAAGGGPNGFRSRTRGQILALLGFVKRLSRSRGPSAELTPLSELNQMLPADASITQSCAPPATPHAVDDDHALAYPGLPGQHPANLRQALQPLSTPDRQCPRNPGATSSENRTRTSCWRCGAAAPHRHLR